MSAFSPYIIGHFSIAVSQAVASIPLLLSEPGSMKTPPTKNQHTVSDVIAISERQGALAIRAAWMRRMGLSQQEIDQACSDPNEPINVAEETENLRAAEELPQATPPSSELKKWATNV